MAEMLQKSTEKSTLSCLCDLSSLWLVASRALIMCSIGSLAITWKTDHGDSKQTFQMALSAVILIHRLTAVIAWHHTWRVWTDFVSVCLEIAGWFVLNHSTLSPSRNILRPWLPEITIACYLLTWLQGLLLLGLFAGMVIDGRRQKYMVKVGCPLSVKGFSPHRLSSMLSPKNLVFALSVLLGRRLFPGPNTDLWLRITRLISGMFAILFGSALVAFALLAILILPIHERGLVPIKEYRTDNALTDTTGTTDPVRTVTAIMNIDDPNETFVELFKAAVLVTPLWDDENDLKPACEYQENQSFNLETANVPSIPTIFAITFKCPTRFEASGIPLNAIDFLTMRPSWSIPDLLIDINFTTIGITPESESLVDARLRAVSIIVGLTRSIDDVVESTAPIPIFPDMHLLAAASIGLRRRYNNPPLATFASSLSTQRTFYTYDIEWLVPDLSPLIPRENNVATLRIFVQDDASEWVLVSDHRENDVATGTSAVGGLWTSLNAIFAFLFGANLLWITLGKKPLTIFGILHNIPQFKRAEIRSVVPRNSLSSMSRGENNGQLPDRSFSTHKPQVFQSGTGSAGAMKEDLIWAVAILRDRILDLDQVAEYLNEDSEIVRRDTTSHSPLASSTDGAPGSTGTTPTVEHREAQV